MSTTLDPGNRFDLDPDDWAEFRRLAHEALDEMISHVETIRQRPVWRDAPQSTRKRFTEPLPVKGRGFEGVLQDVKAHVVPFSTGNVHPGFMGWVHGAGTPIGIVAEMISAALNMNCGGRNHIGLEVERQVVQWLQQALGYPETASGLFVGGSSMANILAVLVAKVHALGPETRRLGLKASKRQLIAYTSAQAHRCIGQAMEASGIGSDNLRRVAVDAAGRMEPIALQAAIADDRAAGLEPFLVVATAGTVNTGAIDPLAKISAVAASEKLWFHVDGAIGALATFSPELRSLFEGIETSHSVALDFHKWGHVPYDAGFLLVRDGAVHKQTFAYPAAYLQPATRGLAAGDLWPCDLGLDLSRTFRALKTWMTIETLGIARIGAAILHNCELARYLETKIEKSPIFELKAPVTLNIVCFGVRGVDASNINRELVLDVQESGIAAPSWTTINGETVIRCAIVNHRTVASDIDAFVDTITRLAKSRAVKQA